MSIGVVGSITDNVGRRRMSRTQAKHWCFTINNYTEDEVVAPDDQYVYMIIGKEMGQDGTPHLQGYVAMKKKKTLAGMKKMFPRAHLEVMRGTPKQAADYCKKDGDYAEKGDFPGNQTEEANKKRKADYELAVDLAKKQKLYEVEASLLLRHGSNLRMIQKDHPITQPNNDYLCGIWLYGPPGCGKSSQARWMFPNAYPKPLNKWWDGYQNEEYVILDDIEPDHKCLGHHLKQWTDHYAFTAEQKGTSIRIRPKAIIVTTNYQIEEIWEGRMAEAIRRRFTVINCEIKKLKY